MQLECGTCNPQQSSSAAHAVGLLWFSKAGRFASRRQQLTGDVRLLQSSEPESDGESEMSAHDTLLPEAETRRAPAANILAAPEAKRLKAAPQ